jgi:hypothetical protein
MFWPQLPLATLVNAFLDFFLDYASSVTFFPSGVLPIMARFTLNSMPVGNGIIEMVAGISVILFHFGLVASAALVRVVASERRHLDIPERRATR